MLIFVSLQEVTDYQVKLSVISITNNDRKTGANFVALVNKF